MTEQTVEQVIAFGPLRITYDDRVLRPREWTTMQSRWAAERLAAVPGAALELCCGAGQIGLLAVALEPRRLVCVDISTVACAYARRNAAAAGLGSLVEVREGRAEDVLDPAERFGVVIVDPPWVPSDETGRFPADPLLAIDGGPDGLDVARGCLEVAAGHLLRRGEVLIQLGTEEQAGRLAEASELSLREVRRGERGVVARLAHAEQSAPTDRRWSSNRLD